MDFALSDEQEMLRSLIERFVSDRYAGGARSASRSTQRGYSAENWAMLAEIGLLGLPISEDFGGSGGGDGDITTAMEAFGRGLVAEPVLNEIVLAGRLLEAAGTGEQKQVWLPRIVAGRAHVVLAHAEHATRFDLARCGTRFENGRISGGKTAVPAGADAFIVTARSNGEVGLFLSSGDAPGITRRDYRLVDGSVASEISFNGSAAQPMQGSLASLQAVVDTARMAACAEMVGLMGLLLDTTLDYVRERRQFGVPIGSFQAIQHRLADVYASLELSRSHLYRCVLAEPQQLPAAIAGAKSYISTAAIALGETCIQLHGGMGVSDEVMIGHAHKRILVLARFFGDADHELVRYNRALATAETAS